MLLVDDFIALLRVAFGYHIDQFLCFLVCPMVVLLVWFWEFHGVGLLLLTVLGESEWGFNNTSPSTVLHYYGPTQRRLNGATLQLSTLS